MCLPEEHKIVGLRLLVGHLAGLLKSVACGQAGGICQAAHWQWGISTDGTNLTF